MVLGWEGGQQSIVLCSLFVVDSIGDFKLKGPGNNKRDDAISGTGPAGYPWSLRAHAIEYSNLTRPSLLMRIIRLPIFDSPP